ncbi:MAG: bifunctional hydroxymethylpyrimidine kinase/phosphomethylpyrimidine kinase [Myxococcota bacterium]
MPTVLVISSYVAASRVGGSIAPLVLGPMGIETILAPTCLFGRHPGRGDPGGAAVSAETLEQLLRGIEADGVFPQLDAILTGHFSQPAQVDVAAGAIARARAAHPAPERLQVVVDPIMGDEGPGRYIREAVAQAIAQKLVPIADIVAPNRWEFARLCGVDLDAVGTAEDIATLARRRGGRWMISSVPAPAGIGAMVVEAGTAIRHSTPRVKGTIPNGTGDLLTLWFVGEIVRGAAPGAALLAAVEATHRILSQTVAAGARDLILINRGTAPGTP